MTTLRISSASPAAPARAAVADILVLAVS